MSSLVTFPRVSRKHARTSPDGRLRFDTVVDNAGFARIRDDWTALEALGGRATLFQSAQWCATFLAADQMRGARDRRGAQPLIVTAHDGARLVGALPLAVARNGLVRVARPLGEPLTQYADMPCLPGAMDVAVELIAMVPLLTGVDVLALRRIREGSCLYDALKAAGMRLRENDHAREAALDEHRDIYAFGAAVHAKAARERRRLRRRLDDAGTVELRHLPAGAEAVRVLTEALDWKRSWLSRRRTGSLVFGNARWSGMIAGFAADPALNPLTSVVSIDGTAIAVEFGFDHQGRHYCFFGATRPGFERSSPGKIAMEATVAHCLENGISHYDLLGPDDAYKREWCPQRIALYDAVIPLSATGRAWVHSIEGIGRPLARRIAPYLPAALRHLLFRTASEL